jgi:hypothetical protein
VPGHVQPCFPLAQVRVRWNEMPPACRICRSHLAHSDRPVLTPPHDLLQSPPFPITQPSRPHRLSHHAFRHLDFPHKIECEPALRLSPDRVNVVVSALAGPARR